MSARWFPPRPPPVARTFVRARVKPYSTAFAIPRSIRARLEAAESSLTRPEVYSEDVRRSFTTEAVTSRPRLADRDLVERDLRDANFASPFPETQKATMTSTLAPARARQLCARSSVSTRKKRPEAFTVQVRRVQAKWRLVDCRPDHAAWLKFGTDPGLLPIGNCPQHPPQHFIHFPAKLGTHFPNFQLQQRRAKQTRPTCWPQTTMNFITNGAEGQSLRQSQSQSAFLPSLRDVPVTTASLGSARGSSRCLLYTSPSPRDRTRSRMPSSA